MVFTIENSFQTVVERGPDRDIDNVLQITIKFTLELRTEQEEIHIMAMKRKITHHLKLLYASHHNISTYTWETMHDHPLQSE